MLRRRAAPFDRGTRARPSPSPGRRARAGRSGFAGAGRYRSGLACSRGVAPAAGQAAAAPAETAGERTPATPTGADIAELNRRIDELEAQQAETVASAEEEDQRFKIYGFLDFGLKKSFPSRDPFFAALIERKLTFVLGNINLYFDAQPTANWRALIETRLTTYPHGAETVDASGQFTRTDTSVFDTNSPSGRNQVAPKPARATCW